MYLVAIAWLYVALMMAVAEATSTQGSLLGAIITFVLYGLAPVALVMYLLSSPTRMRARKRAERERAASSASVLPAVDPDRGRHPAGAAEGGMVAAEREEP